MKAIPSERYGGPDNLRVADLPVPTPGRGQVLVEVVATSVNLSDWETLRGYPAYARIGGLTRPRRRVLGSDIAGRIVALGPGVTGFAVGDEVYGDNLMLCGGFAEYAVMPVDVLLRKPAGLTFAQASTLPQAGAIALQGTAGMGPEQRVLINGAGGGSGMFAIQLAKRSGAHVTGVDNAAKQESMLALGADEVIDYLATDPALTGPYDRVLDFVAYRSVFAYLRMLVPGGRYRCVGGTTRSLLRIATIGALAGRVHGRDLGVLAVRTDLHGLAGLARSCENGEVRITIDRTYPLEEAADAVARVGAGQALGKVVVQIRDE